MHVTEFKKENELVTNRKEIVNRFNDYSVNVGPNLAKTITTKFNNQASLEGKFYGFDAPMLLSPVCEQEIKRELENLDPSKSCGHQNYVYRYHTL